MRLWYHGHVIREEEYVSKIVMEMDVPRSHKITTGTSKVGEISKKGD